MKSVSWPVNLVLAFVPESHRVAFVPPAGVEASVSFLLSRQPAEFRSVLEMRYRDGLSEAAMASCMQLTPAQVSEALSRALASVRADVYFECLTLGLDGMIREIRTCCQATARESAYQAGYRAGKEGLPSIFPEAAGDMADLRNWPVSDLPISFRTRNRLAGRKIHTVGQLVRYPLKKLLKAGHGDYLSNREVVRVASAIAPVPEERYLAWL